MFKHWCECGITLLKLIKYESSLLKIDFFFCLKTIFLNSSTNLLTQELTAY